MTRAQLMKCQTSKLIGSALDWVVAKCEEYRYGKSEDTEELVLIGMEFVEWNPSTNWSQGGPIIEREKLDVWFRVEVVMPNHKNQWAATYERGLLDSYVFGPTPLIAAMRCYVASKLGEEIEIPKELKCK